MLFYFNGVGPHWTGSATCKTLTLVLYSPKLKSNAGFWQISWFARCGAALARFSPSLNKIPPGFPHPRAIGAT